jgi:hypothetical protein
MNLKTQIHRLSEFKFVFTGRIWVRLGGNLIL